MGPYSVSKLSEISGVSIRTLHHYDKIGLLKPALRTDKNYRIYSQSEVYRLQQILFYKEIGISLLSIKELLDERQISHRQALIEQKEKLLVEQNRISILIKTIDNTILRLNGDKMITDKELYEGFPDKTRKTIRKESIEKFGSESVLRSENHLKSYSKKDFNLLIKEQAEIFQNLLELKESEVANKKVQFEIARHYNNTRKFWGTYGNSSTQKKQYKALGELYLHDQRYTEINGMQYQGFPEFLNEAIQYFVKTQLN